MKSIIQKPLFLQTRYIFEGIMYYIIGGISLIFFGFAIIVNPVWYDSIYGMQFDFSGIKWPFGGFLIILGVAFIYSELRKRKKIPGGHGQNGNDAIEKNIF